MNKDNIDNTASLQGQEDNFETSNIEVGPLTQSPRHPSITDVPKWDSSMTETSFGFDEASREQLDKIKARTMYNMVEPINGGAQKILFMTNSQALLLAKEQGSMKKMLDTLEIGNPELVINLLESRGMGPSVNALGPRAYDSWRRMEWGAGLVSERPAFVKQTDEASAVQKLDLFMSNVLVPLAAETNAVVLCSALTCDCALSESFLRTYAAKRAKWGEKEPFTVLSLTANMRGIYCNPNLDAYWRQISRNSRNWMMRDATILQCVKAAYGEKGKKLPSKLYDLDSNAKNFIIFDSIDSNNGSIQDNPFNKFKTELVRTLSSQLPSLALKTGFSSKHPSNNTSGSFGSTGSVLKNASDASQSGTPTVLLDFRDRPTLSSTSDRAELIDEAKEKFIEHCEEYRAAGLVECMDVCTYAYFHDVLTGDGSHLTTETSSHGETGKNKRRKDTIPLHEAIGDTSSNDLSSRSKKIGLMQRANMQQIGEVADWVAHKYFQDAWELLSEEQKEEGKSYDKLYASRLSALSTAGRELLASENTYHVNLVDIEGAAKLVNMLVRLDRLPKENSHEGLLLLRSAWCNYDIAMHLADRYKCWCKLMFAVQLCFSWLVVAISAASQFVQNAEKAPETAFNDETTHRTLEEIVFGVSLLLSLFLSLASLMDSKAKWRALRSGACTLQSAIWLYRTRVGPFEIDEGSSNSTGKPEKALVRALEGFGEDLASGASIGTSNFHKQHKASVFKHYQYEGRPDPDEDDYQSPLQPHNYIKCRVEPTLQFYAKRIPIYNRRSNLYNIVLILLSIGTSILARYHIIAVVVAVTAAAGSLTSWIEFTDFKSKAHRYNSATTSLKNILNWWDSISDVRKASRESIEHLIFSCETIIAEERIGWTSLSKPDGKSVSADSDLEVVGTKLKRGGAKIGGMSSGRGTKVVPSS